MNVSVCVFGNPGREIRLNVRPLPVCIIAFACLYLVNIVSAFNHLLARMGRHKVI